MVLFDTAKESLRMVGILAISKRKHSQFLLKYRSAINHIHVFLVMSWIMSYLLSSVHFILFKANTFGQYFGSGLYCVLNILRIIVYLNLFSQIKQMSNLWKEAESTIDKRESVPFFFQIRYNFLLFFFSYKLNCGLFFISFRT